MKKSSLHSIVILTTLTIVLYACGSGSDKHAELEKLKKEQATLKERSPRWKRRSRNQTPVETMKSQSWWRSRK